MVVKLELYKVQKITCMDYLMSKILCDIKTWIGWNACINVEYLTKRANFQIGLIFKHSEVQEIGDFKTGLWLNPDNFQDFNVSISQCGYQSDLSWM